MSPTNYRKDIASVDYLGNIFIETDAAIIEIESILTKTTTDVKWTTKGIIKVTGAKRQKPVLSVPESSIMFKFDANCF